MPISTRPFGIYDVSGTNNTLNLRWSQIWGRGSDDTIVLNKKNIGGWGYINLGSGNDSVRLAEAGSYTLQLVGTETIRADQALTNLRFRSDVTTSTDGSFEAITAGYGVQHVTFTGALRANTIELGDLIDKVTFANTSTAWAYVKTATGVDVYDLTSGLKVDAHNNTDIINVDGVDVAFTGLATGTMGGLGNITLSAAPSFDSNSVTFTTSAKGVAYVSSGSNPIVNSAQSVALTRNSASTLSLQAQPTAIEGALRIYVGSATSGLYKDFTQIYLGTTGNDTRAANNTASAVYGFGGNDTLNGGTAADTVYGGTGNDSLVGGGGADLLYGEAGNDIFDFASGAQLTAAGAVNGGDDTDTIKFTAAATDIDDSDFSNVSNIEAITLSNGTNTIVLGALAAAATSGLTITGGTGNDTINISALGEAGSIIGGDGNDVLTGGSANDTISGGNGDDALTGGAGNDVITAGDGNDTIIGADAGDTIDGGQHNDTLRISANYTPTADGNLENVENISITGNAASVTLNLSNQAGEAFNVTLSNFGDTATTSDGADSIGGGSGNDSIVSGDGNDTVHGGAGQDTLNGGNNTDTLTYADVTSSTSHGLANLAGLAINLDTTTVTAASIDTAMDAVDGAANFVLGGGNTVAGTDLVGGTVGYLATDSSLSTTSMVRDTVSNFEVVIGSALSDFINAGQSAQTIDGADGNDVIWALRDYAYSLSGGAGNDVISYGGSGTASDVTVSGGDGDDLIDADDLSEGQDSLNGGAGNDTIYGGGGADNISGDDGDDTLNGEDGDDILNGGNGNDTINAGEGSDTIINSAGGDTVNLGTDSSPDTLKYTIQNTSGIQTATLSPVYGDDSGYDVITNFDAGSADKFYLEGYVKGTGRALDGTGQSSTTATVTANAAIPAAASILLVSNSSVSSTGDVSLSIAQALDGAYDLNSLEPDEELIFSVASDVAGKYWVGIYKNAGNDDDVTGNDVQILALVTKAGGGEIDFDNFTDGTVTQPQAASLAALIADPNIVLSRNEGGNSTYRTDNIANRVIAVNDKFQGVSLISFTPFSSISVPSTFGGFGDNQVHNSQFEVYYGTSDGTTFTVTGAPGNMPASQGASLRGATHTLVLYDADGSSSANTVKGFYVEGVFAENQWSVVDRFTSNARMIYNAASASSIENALYGGTGNDTLNGLAGNDYISGGSGNDSLTGGDGDDTIFGGVGDDTINGATGNDSIDAGDGNDTISFDMGVAGHVPSLDAAIDGGLGTDTMYVWRGDTANLTLVDSDFTNVSNMELLSLMHGNSSYPISVTLGAQAVEAFATGVNISKTGGTTLNVNGASFTNSIVVTGGTGNDTLTGGSGADTIIGGAGADSLNGGNGNDVMVFADAATLSGDATVIGGADNDTIRIDSAATALSLADADFTKVTGFETLALNGTGTQEITLGSATDASFISGITITTVATATSLNLQGAASTVSINVTGTNNADTMVGGSAEDTITGGAGNDTITGGAGNDTITGGAGNDSLVGGAGDDTFIFDGSSDTDVIDGGADNDVLRVIGSTDFTASTFTDIEYIVIGQTTATFSGTQLDNSTLKVQAVNTSGISILEINGAGNFSQLDFVSTTIAGASAWDPITYNDKVIINGTSADDTITGSTVFDSIIGGGGNDTIDGNDGNDTIDGNDGNDIITGGAGADVLTGGAGDDDFVYLLVADSAASVAANITITFDSITDFTTTEDQFSIEALADILAGGDATGVTVTTLTTGGASLNDTTIANFAELKTAIETSNGGASWLVASVAGAAGAATGLQAYVIDLTDNMGALGTGLYLVLNNNDTLLTAGDVMIALTGTSTAPVAADFIV